jgi:hypothetical protein
LSTTELRFIPPKYTAPKRGTCSGEKPMALSSPHNWATQICTSHVSLSGLPAVGANKRRIKVQKDREALEAKNQAREAERAKQAALEAAADAVKAKLPAALADVTSFEGVTGLQVRRRALLTSSFG